MELEMPIASAATTTRRVSDRTARSLFRTAPAFVSSARWAVGLLALLASLALLPSAPAQAQAVVELVSNYYEANARPTRSTSGKAAQSFTTGANTDGYILTEVKLHAQNGFASVVAIREDNGGIPGNLVVRLTSGGTSSGNRTYAAAANTRLNASTKYWVVVNDAGRGDAEFWTTSSNAETGLTGFAIGDTAREFATASRRWTDVTSGNSMSVAIRGYVNSVDTTPPTVSYGQRWALSPPNGQTGVPVSDDLILNFSEPVRKGSGNIVIRPASGPAITIPVTSSQVSVSGRTVTINPTNNLTAGRAYRVRIAAGAFEDLAGNDYAGIADNATWAFITKAADTTAPTVSAFINPVDNASAVPMHKRKLLLQFSERVRKVSGNIVIRPASGPDVVIPVTDRRVKMYEGAYGGEGMYVEIDATADLAAGTAYHVRIPAGAFEDLSGNDYAGIADATTWNFATAAADTTAPTVRAYSPAGGPIAVPIHHRELYLAFWEPVRKGSGNIVIRPASGPDIVIPVTDRRVRVGGVGVLIDATADLATGTTYHVRIDAGAFEDLAGNDYAGIADATTWRFTTKAADTTAPTLYRGHGSPYNGFPFTPVSGATAVQTNEDLYIYFTEPVRKGSGNIVIRPASGPDIVIPVTDKRVEVHKNQKRAAIYASGNGSRYHTLQPNTAYHVRIDSGAFEDWSGNDYAGIADATTWNFTTATTDTTAPTVSSLSPADGATGVPVNAHLVLTFSEWVNKGIHRGSGNIVIRPASGPDIVIPVADSQVSVTHSGSRVTIDLAADLAPNTAYHVRIDAAAFEDRSGNDYAGIGDATTWNFTTGNSTVEDPLDPTAPTLEAWRPAHSVSDDIVLYFNEAVRKGSGNIVIRPASGSDIVIPVTDSQVSVSERSGHGWSVTIDPAADLAARTAYRVLIAAGAIEDLAGNAWAGRDDNTALRFTTAASVPVVTGFGPCCDANAVDTTLVLQFSGPVRKGSGNITIRPASGADIVIPVTDSQVSVSGSTVTIDPASDLAAGTAYHVLIANGAIENLSGDAWAGIADANYWTFTTAGAPTVGSFIPADNASGVPRNGDLVLTFSKAVRKGNGNIVIKAEGFADIAIPVTDRQVSVSGSTVTIDPAADLAASTAYHVRIDAGAFEDRSGNDYAGIADATTWNFTTSASDTDTTVPLLSTATVSGATLVLTYDEALDTGSTPTASAYRVKVSGGSGAGGASSGAAPSSVSISGSAVTLTLATAVTHGQTVTVSYTKPGTNPVQDSVGNDAAALTDRAVTNTATAPTVSTYSPADGEGDVAANARLVLTFGEPVRKGSGDIVIRPASGPDITVPVTGLGVGIYGGGRRVIIDYSSSVSVLAAGTDYHVRIDAGAFEDLSGNDYAGIADATTWNFTTASDTTAPTVSSFSPADGATDVGVGQYLFFNFSEQVRKGSGDIVIRPASGPDIVIPVTDSRVSVWDSAIQISHDPQLAAGTAYHVLIANGAIEDLSGNDYAGIADATTWNFTTAGAPTVGSFIPADNASGVPRNGDLVLNFSKAVRKGNGNIVIKAEGFADIAIPVTDSQVSVSGRRVTINPAADLAEGTAYHVLIPAGAFEDRSGNDYAGIADAATWNFTTADTTAPTVSTYSPADGGTAVAVDENLVLTFSEAVRKGSGFVIIRPASGSETVIVVTDTDSQVSVSGSTVTIDPTADLAAGTDYQVLISSGAIEDLTGNLFTGITADNPWSFTTVAAAQQAQGQASGPAGFGASAGDGQVVLTWTAVPGVTGWEVRRRTYGTGRPSDNWSAWTAIDGSGAATARHAVTGLTNGLKYGFQVRALAGEDAGPASDEATARPVSATGTLPTAPADLTAEGRDGDVMLRWTMNLTAHRWEYRQRTGDGAFGDWIPMGSHALTRQYIVGGLENGTAYGFEVRAVNARGEGPASSEVTATPAAPAGGPAKPVVTAEDGVLGVTLSWAANADAAGWQYRVKVGDGDWGRWWDMVLASPGTATGYEATAQSKDLGVRHGIQVRAWSGTGASRTYGAASDAVHATPQLPPNAAPSFTSPASFEVAENGTAVGTVVAEDADPHDAVRYAIAGGVDEARFSIDRMTGELSFRAAPDHELPEDGSRGETGVVGDNVYHVTVRAASGADERRLTVEQAIEVTVTNADEDPTGLPAVSGTVQVGGTLTADTSRIADPDGLTSPRWRWQWIRVAEGGAEEDIDGATSSTYTPVSADAGGTLKVRVDFTDDGGFAETLTSAATATVAAEAALAAPDVRPEPNDARVTLRWAAVEGATAYQYRMKTVPEEGEDPTAFATWSSAGGEEATSTTVTELVNGTEYVFEMRAGAEGGTWSGSSAEVRATPQVPPGQPTVFVAVPVDGGVQVAVVPVANATGYEYRLKGRDGAADGPWTLAPHDYFADFGTDLLTLAGLPGGEHRFEVRAKTGEVPGPASEVHTVTVAGAGASLSVADASVAEPGEGESAELRFQVTLAPAASGTVTVDYATSDGTATVGADYTSATGTLTFAAGETSRTVSVAVLADSHDDSGETLTLTLSNASGAAISDAEATGTIVNDGPLQREWLARFGRTVAGQTIDALESRFAMAPGAPSHMVIAGERLDFSGASPLPQHDLQRDGEIHGKDGETRGMDMRELLLGSSFHFTAGEVAGPGAMTAWGKALSGGSHGSGAGGLSFASETVTGVLGMDWERGNLLIGLALTDSAETGSASSGSSGYDIEGSLFMATPYARLRASDRLSFWTMIGSGEGSMGLSYDGGVRQSADIAMRMVAAGSRAELLRPGENGGLALALKTDAFFVRTESESVSTAGVGRLAGAAGDASRVRAVLEGSRAFALSGGGSVEPSLTLGLRRDGGDAETGTGVEIGAGLAWSDPSNGITSDLRFHGLAAHEDGRYEEWGVSGSLSIVPDPSGRGVSLSMTPSWGAQGQGGRVWDAQPSALVDEGAAGERPGGRLDTELGYGLFLSDHLTGTPYMGLGFGQDREYRLGWRFASGRWQSFSLGLEATRREAANDNGAGTPVEHGVTLNGAIRW